MMGVLQKINRETFQTFKLRVGQFYINAIFIIACPEIHSRTLSGYILLTTTYVKGKTTLK
jgi:hypothetical protein